MTLGARTSISMAFCLAGSVTTAPSPLSSSKSSPTTPTEFSNGKSKRSKMGSKTGAENAREFSLYKGISNRPLGWKVRRKIVPAVGPVARDANVKRWDGAAKTTSEWDGLRRDPELWFPEGDCLVHLYGYGQSKRGPAFKVPLKALLEARCRPLIDQFLVQDLDLPPISERNSTEYAGNWDQSSSSAQYELYIPAPLATERGQAMLHHIATRNLFAWIFKKPVAGSHLGGALVTLLNSMKEFRSAGLDNVADVLEYVDQQGYADMPNHPDYALAILFLAEHFEYRDIWIDAYAHCAGMNEKLFDSSEFKHISLASRTLIRRGRLEMDTRLGRCGKSLSTFLEDELSSSYLGLSAGARDHLDRFQAFLQAHYVDKLGYYPPSSLHDGSSAFPKDIYAMMALDFQNLYEFLADENFSSYSHTPLPAQRGFCVLQNIQAFDQRHRCRSLPHPLPLLPQPNWDGPRLLKGKMSWTSKASKFKVDDRLLSLSSLAKASNRHYSGLLECPLVHAFCKFEKNYLFSSLKSEKTSRVSLIDARKVCWMMIYAMLQILRNATIIPEEVRDTEGLSYNICVRTADCPPWQNEKSGAGSLRKEEAALFQDWDETSVEESFSSALSSPYTESFSFIKPDIDYFHSRRQSSQKNSTTQPQPPAVLRKGTVRRALLTLGNMPELRHPRPVRNSFHEILVQGYGNGLNTVSFSPSTSPAPELLQDDGNSSSESPSSPGYLDTVFSSTWSSNWSSSNESGMSPPSIFIDSSHNETENYLSKMDTWGPSSNCGDPDDMESSSLRPEPLDLLPGKVGPKNPMRYAKRSQVES